MHNTKKLAISWAYIILPRITKKTNHIETSPSRNDYCNSKLSKKKDIDVLFSIFQKNLQENHSPNLIIFFSFLRKGLRFDFLINNVLTLLKRLTNNFKCLALSKINANWYFLVLLVEVILLKVLFCYQNLGKPQPKNASTPSNLF